jgi:hypothetical protein
LFEEDTEKCLAFLNTLKSHLIKDPFINRYYKEALQARKTGNVETIQNTPVKNTALNIKNRGVSCLVCGEQNTTDRTHCWNCHAIIQSIKSAEDSILRDLEAQQAKLELLNPSRRRLAPAPGFISRIRPSKENAKYYALLIIGCLCLGSAWWAIDRFLSTKPNVNPGIDKTVPSQTANIPASHDLEATPEKSSAPKIDIIEAPATKKADIAVPKPKPVLPPKTGLSCTDVLQTFRTKQDQANQLYEEEKYDNAELIYRQIVNGRTTGCGKKVTAELRQLKNAAKARINKINLWKSQ